MKKLWFIALAMFILCVLCGAAMADETIYTVTIEPGEGSGNTFTVQSKTIISQSEMVAGNYDQTKGCFYDGDGTIFIGFQRSVLSPPQMDRNSTIG